MTDKNAALAALKQEIWIADDLDQHDVSLSLEHGKALYAALSSPSPAVDVSRVRDAVEYFNDDVPQLSGYANEMIIALVEHARNSLPAMREAWQPIESAPRDGTHITVWNPDRWEPDTAWYNSKAATYPWVTWDNAYMEEWPSFWRPMLPEPTEPPKGEKS